MKKTAWYPASVNPVRKGWYEVSRWFGAGSMADRLKWDGHGWKYDRARGASMDDHFGDKWRGLTEQAK